MTQGWLQQRKRMIYEQIFKRGVRHKRILQAFMDIPREAFVPANYRAQTYADKPLPIGEGQTISQPYVVAHMLSLLQLQATERVLEIGAGSGYAAALLGKLVVEVYAIERHEVLAKRAQARLHQLNYDNVTIVWGDGTQGLPAKAPFDAILVSAAGPTIPNSLKQQLAIGGRLLIPVGKQDEKGQRLVLIKRTEATTYKRKILQMVRFVPLIGKEGWQP